MKTHRETRQGRQSSNGVTAWVWMHWKLNLLTISLMFLSMYIACSIAGLLMEPETKNFFNIKPIPLSSENLEAWMRDTDNICWKRDKKKIQIPTRTVAEFIEWLRKNPELFDNIALETKPETYLGVTLALEESRKNYRDLIEHEIRCEEINAFAMNNPTLADRLNMPERPLIQAREQKDLDTYQMKEIPVENLLSKLMPMLPPLVPAWDNEPQAPAPLEWETEENRPTTSAKRISWKMVSRSWYGPKTIRKKPGTSKTISRSPSLKERMEEE